MREPYRVRASVFAALGVVLSMVVIFARLSAVADSAEPRLPAAVTPASAVSLQAVRRDASALSSPSVVAIRPSETVALREKLNSYR
jgi:hypothetical protein